MVSIKEFWFEIAFASTAHSLLLVLLPISSHMKPNQQTILIRRNVTGLVQKSCVSLTLKFSDLSSKIGYCAKLCQKEDASMGSSCQPCSADAWAVEEPFPDGKAGSPIHPKAWKVILLVLLRMLCTRIQ